MIDNTVAARMMNSEPFGDSLTASFFGTAAQLWGDQSIHSAQNMLLQSPEPAIPTDNQNQRQKLYAAIGHKQRNIRLCGGVNQCPDDEGSGNLKLKINKQGDVYFRDDSINVAAPNIPQFVLPNYDRNRSVGGNPITFLDVAGDRYTRGNQLASDTRIGGLLDDIYDFLNSAATGTNNCASVCADVKNDPEAYRLCTNYCEKKNSEAKGKLTRNITLLAVGALLLAIGVKSLAG